TVLAMLFLGERIHRFRWTALGIGFIGVLITIGPHLSFTHGASAGVLIGLANAVLSATAMVFLRSMGGRAHAIAIPFCFPRSFMFWAGLTGVQGWPMPTPTQWLLIVLAGLFGVFGQLLMTLSYRYAEASTIPPLDSSKIYFAIVIGYAFFDETPALSIWIGAPLILASA